MADYREKRVRDYEMKYWMLVGIKMKKQYNQYLKLFNISNDFGEKTVLDIGCGPFGGMLSIIKAKRKIGIDPMMNDYKKEFKDKINLDSIEVRNEFVEDITLPTNIADVIFCVNALDHFLSPPKVVRQIHRLLKKGGVFYLYVHLKTKEELDSYAHVWAFSEKLMKELFKNLELIRSESYYPDPAYLPFDEIKVHADHKAFLGIWRKK